MAAGIAALEFELVAEELALDRWWAITLAAAGAVLTVRPVGLQAEAPSAPADDLASDAIARDFAGNGHFSAPSPKNAIRR